MDYCELLYKAQENKVNASSKEVRCYSTTFGAPKKIERSKVSSENIKRFLARKEEEERRRQSEAKRKKDELLALRSQDKKAQKRVQVMLKRTKSANKSVMADAIDNVNTADTLAGPKQCDEDDYGYVSQEASAFYNKLMDKYQNIPIEQAFPSHGKKEVKDLNAAKDRVKAALLKEAEEELQPHKRKRKRKEHEEKSTVESEEDALKVEEEQEIVKEEIQFKKPKKPLPPPLDFNQILKIAERKQFEPILIEKVETEKEPERLMTKKEKMEYLKEKERRLNKTVGLQNKGQEKVDPKKQENNDSVKEGNSSICQPKDLKKKEGVENVLKKTKTKVPINENLKIEPKLEKSKEKVGSESVEEKLQKSANVWSKPCNVEKIETKKNFKYLEKEKSYPKLSSNFCEKKNKTSIIKKGTSQAKLGPTVCVDELSEIDREIELLRRKRELLASRSSVNKVETNNNNNVKSKIIPRKELLYAKDKQPKTVKVSQDLKKLKMRKRRLGSESDYDSELEDFIDDDVEGGEDYSQHIREIFGYDKSRYRDLDGDECMESNFAQQLKEEFVSTKLGILEDLEDIRKEHEEKRRKLIKKQSLKTKR